jgi:hypothetical protein
VVVSRVMTLIFTKIVPKVMSTFILQWIESIRTNINVNKSYASFITFLQISVPICAFLPALQNLKNASALEVRSSSSQPASHGFLDCLVSLSGQLSRDRTSGSLKEPNPDCRVDGRAVSIRFVFLCTRKQAGNQTGNPKIFIISWTARCQTPSCAAVL